MKVLPWGKKITKILNLPTEQGTSRHDKNCARLIGQKQELLAGTVTRFEHPRLQLADAH